MSLPEKQPSTRKLSPVQLRQRKAAIVNNALLIGDTSHPAVVQKKLLASAPPCTCPAKTETCGKGCTSSSNRCKQERDKRGVWTQECLSKSQPAKSQPVYRLSSGKTASNTDTDTDTDTDPLDCEESSCAEGGQVCPDPDTGCIRDECSDGCTRTVCPGDEEEIDVSEEGIGKLWQGFEDGMKVDTMESLQARANELCGSKWKATIPGGGEGRPDGWIECVVDDDAMMSVKVYEDGKLVSDSQYFKTGFNPVKADGYTPYIHPKAKWNCTAKRWYDNPEGMTWITTGTKSVNRGKTTTTCKDGVTHTRVVEIHYFRDYCTVIKQSNHPGCPGMCLPPPKNCFGGEIISTPDRRWNLDRGEWDPPLNGTIGD